MKIKTNRLVICDLSKKDLQAIWQNSLDDDMRKYVPDEIYETKEEAKDNLQYLISRYDCMMSPLVYGVNLNKENIGYVQAVKGVFGWEVGFHIKKDLTDNGYATEALTAFLPFIKDKLNAVEVVGIVLDENVASQKVLKKCGFELIFEGRGLYQNEERIIKRYKKKL